MINTSTPLFANLVSLSPSHFEQNLSQDAQERIVQVAGLATACSLDAGTHDGTNNRPAFLMPRAYWIPIAAWAGIVVLAMMGYFVQMLNMNVARGVSLRQSWAVAQTRPAANPLATQDEQARRGTAWEDMVNGGAQKLMGHKAKNELASNKTYATAIKVSMR
jgi:hypothetical protein